MTTSYDSVKRQAKQGSDSKSMMDNILESGLDTSLVKVLGGENQDIIYDKHGLLFRKYDPDTGTYSEKELKIVNSTLSITTDNWKTSKVGLGEFDYYNPKTQQMEKGFGLIASQIVGGLMLTEEIGIYNQNGTMTMDQDGLNITNGINSFSVNPNSSSLLTIKKGDVSVFSVSDTGELTFTGNVTANDLALGTNGLHESNAVTGISISPKDVSILTLRKGKEKVLYFNDSGDLQINTSHYMCGDGTWREAPKSSVNKSEIVNMIYPIGSLYMSTSAANPSTLFGGTWEAFGQGRTIIGKTDDGMFSELESVGGAESRSISVAAHTHTIAHTHTVASHSHTISHTHGIGAHSHTIAHTHSIPSHSHTCGSTAISVAQSASHSHAFHMPPNRYGALGVTSAGFGGTSYNGYANIQYSEQGSIGINSQGSNNGHNHSISGTGLTTGGSSATNSGGTSLTTGGSSVANSGASSPKTGDPSATNSGSAGAQNISINITQPYIVVNIWKRTA